MRAIKDLVNSSHIATIFTTFCVANMMAGSAIAQTALGGEDFIAGEALQIEKAVISDFQKAEDPYRFNGFSENAAFYSSIAARFGYVNGSQDSLDYGVSLRTSFSAFGFQNNLRLAYDYARVDDDVSKNRQLFSYEIGRDINENAYTFLEARGRFDDKAAFETDLFAGLGVGIRLIDEIKTTWRAQIGLGYRQLQENDGKKFEETAALFSSRFFHEVSPDIIVTNDTDVLYSDADTLISNDLGVNWVVTGPLSLRYSVLTDYRTDVSEEFEPVDWAHGLSLIYTF